MFCDNAGPTDFIYELEPDDLNTTREGLLLGAGDAIVFHAVQPMGVDIRIHVGNMDLQQGPLKQDIDVRVWEDASMTTLLAAGMRESFFEELISLPGGNLARDRDLYIEVFNRLSANTHFALTVNEVHEQYKLSVAVDVTEPPLGGNAGSLDADPRWEHIKGFTDRMATRVYEYTDGFATIFDVRLDADFTFAILKTVHLTAHQKMIDLFGQLVDSVPQKGCSICGRAFFQIDLRHPCWDSARDVACAYDDSPGCEDVNALEIVEAHTTNDCEAPKVRSQFSVARTFAHELGHDKFFLGDEYVASGDFGLGAGSIESTFWGHTAMGWDVEDELNSHDYCTAENHLEDGPSNFCGNFGCPSRSNWEVLTEGKPIAMFPFLIPAPLPDARAPVGTPDPHLYEDKRDEAIPISFRDAGLLRIYQVF